MKEIMVIGNNGLGDMITYIGMVNYLTTIYDRVFVACVYHNYQQALKFFTNKKIIVYPFDKDEHIGMYTFYKLVKDFKMFPYIAFGNYGAEEINNDLYLKYYNDGSIKRIIENYPMSYYDDAKIPFKYATEYFHIDYPKYIDELYEELFSKYPRYNVIHQQGSNVSIELLQYTNVNINDILMIDVNKNLYPLNHKYHKIADKFVNLSSILFYGKLLENAKGLYLIDSCLHALALMIDISKVETCTCYKRESRFDYALNKFDYRQLAFIKIDDNTYSGYIIQ